MRHECCNVCHNMKDIHLTATGQNLVNRNISIFLHAKYDGHPVKDITYLYQVE